MQSPNAWEIETVQIIANLLKTAILGRPGGLVGERRAPEPEVGGSILTQVAVLCP